MYTSANQSKRPIDYANNSQWGNDSQADRRKKRKSRWGNTDQLDKTIIPGMPTVLPANLNKEQERQYLLHLQIEEISRRLRTGDLGIPPNPEDRSPSPEPIYNNEGKRLNTREYRTRKKLEEERHHLVQEALALNPEFKPPADYKPPTVRVSDKVMIPQEEHPDINFVGLLIGPRGNTLKNLEKETGAKIIIRGKGSVKDGKIGRKDGQPLPGEDEPLHAYVTANNPENVKKAVEKIKEIIQQGIEVPEGQNDLRRQQLRELALLNGTLRENDGLAKLKQLQQAQTIVTNTIVCTICGGTGHIAQDCKQKRPGDTFRMMQNFPQTQADKAKMDSEYMSLMAELGEGPPPPKTPTHHPQQAMPPNQIRHMSVPPPNPMSFNPPWQGMNRPPMMSLPGQPTMNSQSQSQPGIHQPMYQAHPPTSMSVHHGGPPGLQNQQPHSGMPQQQQPGLHQHQQGLTPQAMQQHPPSHGLHYHPHNMQQQNMMPPHSVNTQIQPPPQMGSVTSTAPVAPPMNQFSSAGSVPPWQQQLISSSGVSTSAAVGVPPPTLMTAPPPPPPSSQPPTTMSWMTPPVSSGVPPPPVTSSAPMWQSATVAPPPPPNSHPMPWQVPPPSVQPPMPVAPPPPPPNSQPNFNPVAPPPPPPGGFDVNSMAGGVNHLLVAPPPPPPN
ncbi:hypothetical protein CHS0354_039237 [Potamilus streckersoni]|uniref:Branchpoint-bridging protein n=1 Tax=Potamilus streckersoni TaxID=2493646 RepID=A0AAE0WAK8_9BIVA|nr:hypothetical protein CHS0354_039237 [Potamilus streckersoni]